MTDRAHGPFADRSLFTDWEGSPFLNTPRGAICPGSIASAWFTKAVTAQPPPVQFAHRVQRDLDIAERFCGVPDMAREDFTDIYCSTKSGSTTSAIKIADPILTNVGSGCDYKIVIRDGTRRPDYLVDSITGGDTINLSSAMSEAAPTEGVEVILIAKKKPRPDPADFSVNSFAFKDTGGNWWVAENQTGGLSPKIFAGSYDAVSNLVSKVTVGGPFAFDAAIGWEPGNGVVDLTHLPTGLWDFSGATVTGLTATFEAFPVGAVYVSVDSTNPATALGYGTWSAFGTGRTLIGVDTGDSDFNTVEKTGGAKTVASAGSVAAPTISGSTASESSHTHSVTSNVSVANHSFTQPTIAWPAGVPTASGGAVADHASHTHTTACDVQLDAHTSASHRDGTGTAYSPFTGPASHTVTPKNVVSGGPSATLTHSVTNPTIAWPAGVPTASGGAVDAHSVTNNAVTSGAGSAHSHGAGTLAASAPTFTGSATSVVQPYITVYFWKRTA